MNISRCKILALPAGALALLTVALGANALAAVRAPAAAAYRPMASGPGWRLGQTISIRDRSVLMVGIDAVSDDDAWAAGTTLNEYGTIFRPALEHWDGVSWHSVAVPAKLGQDVFANIAATSADDVWAVTFKGRYFRLHGHRWTSGELPDARSGNVVVDAVKAFGSDDVWAFGYRSVGRPSRLVFAPYAARFNGRRWISIPVPGRGILGSVSATSAHDIWAVITGQQRGMGVPGVVARVIRWNGARWEPVAVQPSLPRHASLATILATADNNVWIGGSVPNNKGGTSEMAHHWNGTAWTPAGPHTVATNQDYYLVSFVTDGQGGFWAIGGNLNGAQRLWHYSSGRWSATLRPAWQLYLLAAVPNSTSTWGVGWSANLAATQIKGVIALHGPVPH